jgi:hypothetical protein
MPKNFYFVLTFLLGCALMVAGQAYANFAPPSIGAGGTGTTTAPVGQVLYGGASAYQSRATTTLSGTAAQISLSNSPVVLGAAGAVLSLPSHVIFPGNFQVANATSTNATTTALDILTRLTFGGVSGTTWSAFCVSITGDAGLCDGNDASGAGGSSAFEIATTSSIAVPDLAYFTKTSGRTTIGSVATTSLTATSPLSLSQPIAVLGTAPSALSISTAGAWSGTAGSLAADGGNCSAGSFPLGVDALGAVQNCTDAWTEAENTSAAYTPQATTLTVAGTAGQITSSAGAQSLAANRTWTLSLPAHVIFPGDFESPAATTTNATTTGTQAIPVGASVITPSAGNIAIDSTSGQLRYSDGTTRVFPGFHTLSFGYSTSTAYTGTSTFLLGPAAAALTVASARCETDTGTLGVSLYDGTNRASYIPTASTTIATFTFTTNNTFTAGETMRVDIGTPASSPTKIACRLKYTYDAD